MALSVVYSVFSVNALLCRLAFQVIISDFSHTLNWLALISIEKKATETSQEEVPCF